MPAKYKFVSYFSFKEVFQNCCLCNSSSFTEAFIRRMLKTQQNSKAEKMPRFPVLPSKPTFLGATLPQKTLHALKTYPIHSPALLKSLFRVFLPSQVNASMLNRTSGGAFLELCVDRGNGETIILYSRAKKKVGNKLHILSFA